MLTEYLFSQNGRNDNLQSGHENINAEYVSGKYFLHQFFFLKIMTFATYLNLLHDNSSNCFYCLLVVVFNYLFSSCHIYLAIFKKNCNITFCNICKILTVNSRRNMTLSVLFSTDMQYLTMFKLKDDELMLDCL